MLRARGLMERSASAALAVAILTNSPYARATDKEACVAAAEAAQRLKKASKLLAAREQLLVCANRECPSIVSNDCTTWLGEVARSMASVTVNARDGQGRPVYNVRVLIDGAPFAPEASGTPLDVDPGAHVFRCERGADAVDVGVTLTEGERAHPIMCEMPSIVEASVPEHNALPAWTPPPAPAAGESGIPWSSWVLGGVGVLSIGSAALFGGLELSQQSADGQPGGCKPRCNNSEIQSIQTKIDVAYVSIGVAVVALGAAVAIALLRPSHASVAVSQSPHTLPASP
jgi:hypothetical protein